MRAFEIAMMCVLLQASIVFVGAMNIFSGDPLASGAHQNQYTSWTVESTLGEDFEDYAVGNSTNSSGILYQVDTFLIGVTWIWQSFIWVMRILVSVVLIYPTLAWVFGVPEELSALIQIGVVMIYIWGWVQWKSNRQPKYFE